ncbi:MAG: FIST C-terminal domain-containing protein, partial [Anaerolineales bacterium]|nr:FIST C-terminal domain-containing protein [Anaerolineales bacterium]
PGVTVTGGLAGDGPHFKTTWVMHNDVISSGMIAAVGFYGERIVLDHGSQGGWDIFGPERLVTRADGPILYELDGKPALELYKTYLGERAAELPAAALLFPLALRNDASDESQIVRTILAIDEAQQSLTFAGNIPEGSRAQLMKANFDRLIDGALGAAEQLDSQQACQGDKLAIAISCVGRRLVLGERTEEELEATLETLPAGTKQIGFYSYGELSPFGSGQCDLHNQTMTLTTISEV